MSTPGQIFRNIKLTIAYEGTDFSGWQRQPQVRTVQGELEAKLALMCSAPVTVHGAGRTDAGVHATAMVANFQTTANISCLGLQKGLNSLLAADVRILAVEEVAAGFHARISAIAKTYRYFFSTAAIQLPHQRRYETLVRGELDVASMEACLPIFLGAHDFAAFEASGSRDRSYLGGRGAVRTLYEVTLAPVGHKSYAITLRGDGFLRKMVRNIVGTLFAVGRSRLAVADVHKVINSGDRGQAGATAPAHGLFLIAVEY